MKYNLINAIENDIYMGGVNSSNEFEGLIPNLKKKNKTMTPKEKAEDLIEKMSIDFDCMRGQNIQCAIACVNEFLSFQENLYITEGSIAYQYWQDVKMELEKI